MNLLQNVKAVAGLLSALVVFGATSANAQWNRYYRTPKVWYLGMEATAGIHAAKIISMSPALPDDFSESLTGMKMALVGGTNALHGKVSYGLFNSAPSTGRKTRWSETSFGFRLFPFSRYRKKVVYLSPFLAAGVSTGVMHFQGNYFDTEEPGASGAVLIHQSMRGTFFNPGVGLVVCIPSRGSFLNIVTEAGYGIPWGMKNFTPMLERTKIMSSLTLSAGVAFGFRRVI